MKAMILAAGLGTRMRPLTDHTPKPLLKAADKPLLQYHIDGLAAAGINNLIINTSWKGDQISDYIESLSTPDRSIEVVHEETPLETAGGIINVLPLLTNEGDAFFIVVNGDVWTDFDFSKLADIAATLSPSTLAHLVLVDNPPQHPEGDFFLLPDGHISSTTSNSSTASSNEKLTFSGISLLSAKLFDGCTPGKRPLAPLLRAAMHNQQVSGHKATCTWMDIGTPERLEQLNQHLLAATAT